MLSKEKIQTILTENGRNIDQISIEAVDGGHYVNSSWIGNEQDLLEMIKTREKFEERYSGNNTEGGLENRVILGGKNKYDRSYETV